MVTLVSLLKKGHITIVNNILDILNNQDRRISNHSLISLFSWGDTAEGSTFWSYINRENIHIYYKLYTEEHKLINKYKKLYKVNRITFENIISNENTLEENGFEDFLRYKNSIDELLRDYTILE